MMFPTTSNPRSTVWANCKFCPSQIVFDGYDKECRCGATRIRAGALLVLPCDDGVT